MFLTFSATWFPLTDDSAANSKGISSSRKVSENFKFIDSEFSQFMEDKRIVLMNFEKEND